MLFLICGTVIWNENDALLGQVLNSPAQRENMAIKLSEGGGSDTEEGLVRSLIPSARGPVTAVWRESHLCAAANVTQYIHNWQQSVSLAREGVCFSGFYQRNKWFTADFQPQHSHPLMLLCVLAEHLVWTGVGRLLKLYFWWKLSLHTHASLLSLGLCTWMNLSRCHSSHKVNEPPVLPFERAARSDEAALSETKCNHQWKHPASALWP